MASLKSVDAALDRVASAAGRAQTAATVQERERLMHLARANLDIAFEDLATFTAEHPSTKGGKR